MVKDTDEKNQSVEIQDNLIEEDYKESAITVPIKMSNKKLRRILIPGLAIALIITILFFAFNPGARPTAQALDFVNYTVEPRDITLTLSGTGSVSPANSYTVTTLISGDILSAPFEEGDIVEKDTILYELDSSNAATSIEQSEISLAQAQRSHEQRLKSLADLQVKSPETGEILELHVELGDDVPVGGSIATLRNSSVMSLEIPFGSDDAASLFVGQSAEVTIDGSFERVNGTISKIGASEERLDGNRLVRTVTIDVENPGAISPEQSATAMVGGLASTRSGTFSYKAEALVTAAVSGEVSAIHFKEGQTVGKNQVIVSLVSDTLQNDVANSSGSLRDGELSLQNRKDQLDDYTIKSPISGTIIEKIYKEGDTLESGKTLCTIFDLSYLTMTLSVDELDISAIEVGQPVKITAEALPNRTYEGYVTKININGTTANGVTSYPVQIRIDETDGLLPGMNAQAEIIVSTSASTLAVPVSALSRGNRILVKTDATSPEEGETGLPAGFTYVEVTPGITDGEFIEITSGLKKDDVIAYIEESVPDSNNFAFGPGGGPQGESGGGAAVHSSGGSSENVRVRVGG